jgi:hypothetical protein
MLLMSSGIAITSIGELQTEGHNFDARGAIAAAAATLCAAIRLVAVEALLGGKSERSAAPTVAAATTTTATAAATTTLPTPARRPPTNAVPTSPNEDSSSDGQMIGRVHIPPSSTSTSQTQPPHTLRALLFIAPFAAIALTPIFFAVEWNDLRASPFVTNSDQASHTVALVIGGACMAFALNMSELCLVRVSSAMTMCVAGVTKFIMVSC